MNRNEDNTFINEKMKIRPDPNKSIFRTSPNSAFFNQAKNKKEDIIVMTKGEPNKYDYSQIKDNKNEKVNKNEINKIEIESENKNEINEYKKKNDIKIENKYKNEIKTKYVKNKDRNRKESKENNKKVDSIMINKLLLQMNDLSVKQLSLIDVMENIQTSATQKIKALNDKIFSLDSLVDDLTNELNELQNQKY